MSVIGIVAEYNPLHHGHEYHIRAARRLTGAEAVICVMSGSFTQRGEPALINKWARSEMALHAGVDLVFELPFVFSTRSAYHFARGAVSLLQKTGVTTHLCFGSELGKIAPLQELAQILHQEPREYRQHLKLELKKGHSFPRARAQALHKYLNNTELHNWAEILGQPNNILALEYLRALLQESSPLTPVTIPRTGQGYHQAGNVKFASATAIRDEIREGRSLDEINGLPEYSQKILKREFACGSGPVFPASTINLIRFSLSRMITSDLAQIYDINEGLENRILKAAQICTSREELIAAIKTRRYSYTRISRVLLYILMTFTQESAYIFDEKGPLYLRLLAFSPQGQKILHDMKVNSDLPIITKLGRNPQFIDPWILKMISFDWMATDLHALLQPQSGPSGFDFLRSPIQIQS